MTPVGLRLNLTPEVLVRLTTEVAGRFKNFLRIKDTKYAGNVYEVNLSILDSYHTGTIDMVSPVNQVIVTREMVGELFDLLGIFPREKDIAKEGRVRKVFNKIILAGLDRS